MNFNFVKYSVAQPFRAGVKKPTIYLRRLRRYCNCKGRERPHQILPFIIHSPEGRCYGETTNQQFSDAIS